MTMAELATVVQENLKVNIAIINNGYLGMVRQWQEFFVTSAITRRRPAESQLRETREAYGYGAWRFRNAPRLCPLYSRRANTTALC